MISAIANEMNPTRATTRHDISRKSKHHKTIQPKKDSNRTVTRVLGTKGSKAISKMRSVWPLADATSSPCSQFQMATEYRSSATTTRAK